MKIEELTPEMSVRVLDQSDVRRLLPERDPYAHKGEFGRVMILAGSMGYTGAAAMAARAALRCGSGLVTVLVPQAVYLIVASKLDEAMVHPVACDGGALCDAMFGALPPIPQPAAQPEDTEYNKYN